MSQFSYSPTDEEFLIAKRLFSKLALEGRNWEAATEQYPIDHWSVETYDLIVDAFHEAQTKYKKYKQRYDKARYERERVKKIDAQNE